MFFMLNSIDTFKDNVCVIFNYTWYSIAHALHQKCTRWLFHLACFVSVFGYPHSYSIFRWMCLRFYLQISVTILWQLNITMGGEHLGLQLKLLRSEESFDAILCRRCEPDPDVSGAIRLHYYSSRAGLYPIVVGELQLTVTIFTTPRSLKNAHFYNLNTGNFSRKTRNF